MTETAVFFLAGEQSTEEEGNRIASLKETHAVTVIPASALSIEGALTGAAFVAAINRASIRAEAKNHLCRLWD